MKLTHACWLPGNLFFKLLSDNLWVLLWKLFYRQWGRGSKTVPLRDKQSLNQRVWPLQCSFYHCQLESKLQYIAWTRINGTKRSAFSQLQACIQMSFKFRTRSVRTGKTSVLALRISSIPFAFSNDTFFVPESCRLVRPRIRHFPLISDVLLPLHPT